MDKIRHDVLILSGEYLADLLATPTGYIEPFGCLEEEPLPFDPPEPTLDVSNYVKLTIVIPNLF